MTNIYSKTPKGYCSSGLKLPSCFFTSRSTAFTQSSGRKNVLVFHNSFLTVMQFYSMYNSVILTSTKDSLPTTEQKLCHNISLLAHMPFLKYLRWVLWSIKAPCTVKPVIGAMHATAVYSVCDWDGTDPPPSQRRRASCDLPRAFSNTHMHTLGGSFQWEGIAAVAV